MNNREYRKQLAEETLQILDKGFYTSVSGKKIDISQLQHKAEQFTKVYTPEESDELLKQLPYTTADFETNISVTNQATLDAVRMLIAEGHEDVLCLNFASAKNPGGGFLGGSQAQEESIARSTGLYNCQIKTQGYYETNRKHKSCMYTDYMIYSPFVPIIKDEDGNNLNQQMHCAIITAPAVNKGVVKHREPGRLQDVEQVMKRRIRKVLAIARTNNHKTLVLGAWGCGVFQNDPNDIAVYFREVITSDFSHQFEKIVFAIYSSNPKFITPFMAEFEQ
ncbi:MAG: TIGR02452 family protein [Crocinitomicaceae bacterium]|nr:TIGR02452 family protein [Crocinitomicaceae bacterium]|tara:strand:+ start:16203 stop:17036 length:834 start_codon:yes stop_codon:yes gene_type:complete